MSNDNKKIPEQQRERLRQEELKKNLTGNLRDAYDRTDSGNLADLVGSLGRKGVGILILLIITGFILVSFFFW